MLTKQFLDDVLTVLNNDTGVYAEPSTILHQIPAVDEDSQNFIRFVDICIHFSSLPLSHDAKAVYVQDNSSFCQFEEEIKQLIRETKHLLFKGIASEYLWWHKHKLEFAISATQAYLDLLDDVKRESTDFCSIACAICRIQLKCNGLNYDKQRFWELCREFHAAYIDDNGYCTMYVLFGLLECNIYSDDIERLILIDIDYYRNHMIFEKAISFRDRLILYYKRTKRAHIHLYADNAHDYENEAKLLNPDDRGNSYRIIDLIHKAMNSWTYSKSSDANENRERLAKYIRPIKESISQSMISIKSNPIDISNIIDYINKKVQNATFEEAIAFIATSVSIKSKDDFLKNDNNSLSAHITKKILDKKGRIITIIPSTIGASESDLLNIAQYNAAEKYRLSVKISLLNYIYSCKRKFEFNAENLAFLTRNNLFVPEGRQETYLKGIVAGFSFDFKTALHLLMPQVENSIRNLAELCDIVVYKTNECGIEECLSMTKILELDEFNDYFDDKLIFNLKVFYTSEYGFGMRDKICHGLLSDEELNSYDGMAVWWFTFYLCCLYSRELDERLRNIREAAEE